MLVAKFSSRMLMALSADRPNGCETRRGGGVIAVAGGAGRGPGVALFKEQFTMHAAAVFVHDRGRQLELLHQRFVGVAATAAPGTFSGWVMLVGSEDLRMS